MKIFVQDKRRNKGEFQFYMHQFVESCKRNGIKRSSEFAWCKTIKLNAIVMRWEYLANIFRLCRKKRAVIVCSSGGFLIYDSFPQNLFAEIIPMFWDSWPSSWEKQLYSLKRLKCKLCFVSSSQVAAKINASHLNTKAYWIPEGIDISAYKKGPELKNRNVDIYEMGRQKSEYHRILCILQEEKKINKLCFNRYNADGSNQKLAFPAIHDLLETLPDIKIVISFPQIDTHPEKAGNIETLTQRYWESMLSRNLIVGRAPFELVDLIGYNPVVNVDWSDPQEQILYILSNIEDYQELVDKNYVTALKYASWDNRIKKIKVILLNNGYTL